MRIAIPNREAMREASQPFRNAIYVARDALFEARHGDFSAADGERFAFGISGGMVESNL
jgi:hypothetical protein